MVPPQTKGLLQIKNTNSLANGLLKSPFAKTFECQGALALATKSATPIVNAAKAMGIAPFNDLGIGKDVSMSH